jgi:hypothetical protein
VEPKAECALPPTPAAAEPPALTSAFVE